jgi:hypothetical protein
MSEHIISRKDFERGVLIFAYDNSVVNYIELAAFCAERVKKFLNVPVCVVTDNYEKAKRYQEFDLIRLIDPIPSENIRNYTQQTSSQFFNHNRYWSQILTPFEETIVIDSDYIIASDQLNVLWGCNQEFLICQKAIDAKGNTVRSRVSDGSIEAVWATIIYFKNTENTRRIFWLVEYLAQRWPYVREQYKIETTVYRNDYSFAIALQIFNGGLDMSNYALPFPMIITGDHDWIDSVSDREVSVNHAGNVIKFKDVDVHILHKESLIKNLRKNAGL